MKGITLCILIATLGMEGCQPEATRTAPLLPSVSAIGEASLFAEGIISTGNVNDELFPTFAPDGRTFYFVRRIPHGQFTIYESRLENERWSTPKVTSFSGMYSDQEPFVSPDGQKLFFTSNRPVHGDQPIAGRDTWVVQWTNGKWGEPTHIGAPVSLDPPPAGSEDRFLGLARGPRVDRKGTLYFWAERPGAGYGATDLYRSRQENGRYTIPENLGPPINTIYYETSMALRADGQLLFFSRDCPEECEGAYGAADIYQSLR